MASAPVAQGIHGGDLPKDLSVFSTIRRAKRVASLRRSAESPSSSAVSSSAVSEDAQPTSTSSTKKDWNLKGSSQLTRWARTRRLRSGKPPADKSVPFAENTVDGQPYEDYVSSANTVRNQDVEGGAGSSSSFGRENMIYMVSDGTGWTVEHSVHCALGQFEHCLIDHGCPVNTHLFSEVNDAERLVQIITDAGKEHAILVYTLADPAMAETAKKACQVHGVSHLDMLGPITELLGSHMGVIPLGLPRGAPGRKRVLSEQYFKRIEAVEFTIKQDDGALPKNLQVADVVLVGVSRTSKTPLSTYMAQKGYKVANVPLVFGIDPPKELFEIDQNKIYALTINPHVLQAIRLARYKSLGTWTSSSYSDSDHIKKELEYSSRLFVQNPTWPVIEVTGKAIEETASVILRIYHDRERKFMMPRISRRY